MSPDNYYGYTGYNLYFFVRYYQAIRHCNLFLENVDKCAELGEIDRRTMRAEARFMRAYYHYLLLRLYGPIPHRRDQPFGRPDRGFAGAQHARRMRPLDQRRDRLGL